MRWLILALDDWGNSGYAYSESLKSVGEKVDGFKINKHPFGYANELEVIGQDRNIFDETDLNNYDNILFIHTISPGSIEDIRKRFSGKIFYHHGGSAYRQWNEDFNAQMKNIADGFIIDTCDLFNLQSDIPELLLPTPVNTDLIIPSTRIRRRTKRVVGHFPSSVHSKGTDDISRSIIKSGKFIDFDIDTEILPHPYHLVRLRSIDIYVDQFQPEQMGKPMGEYGIASREVASMAKIPISTHLHREIYEREIGPTEIVSFSSPSELESELEKWGTIGEKEFMEKCNKCRQWITANHSYKSTGKRLVEWRNSI